MKAWIFAAAACAIASPAAAQDAPPKFDTIQDYLDLCTSADSGRKLACLGFTKGIVYGMIAGQFMVQRSRGEAPHMEAFCMPDVVDFERVRDIAVAEFGKVPAGHRNELLFRELTQGIASAFPCPPGAAPPPKAS